MPDREACALLSTYVRTVQWIPPPPASFSVLPVRGCWVLDCRVGHPLLIRVPLCHKHSSPSALSFSLSLSLTHTNTHTHTLSLSLSLPIQISCLSVHDPRYKLR